MRQIQETQGKDMARVDEKLLERVLCTLYLLTGDTTHARYPLEAIASKFRRDIRGLVREALEELRRRGLIYRAGGKGKTYGLTRRGLEKAREACIGE